MVRSYELSDSSPMSEGAPEGSASERKIPSLPQTWQSRRERELTDCLGWGDGSDADRKELSQMQSQRLQAAAIEDISLPQSPVKYETDADRRRIDDAGWGGSRTDVLPPSE